MSKEERTGWRDELFSKWHRQIEPNNKLACVDGDWNEICRSCYETLAIFELCANVANTGKVATATQKRAAQLDIPAYILLYYGGEVGDRIKLYFRVRRLHPKPVAEFREASERQVAALIWNIHRLCHHCGYSEKLPQEIPVIPGFGRCIHGIVPELCKVCNGEVKDMLKKPA